METEHVLTLLNTSSAENDQVEGFENWLAETGASEVTVENYGRGVRVWLETLKGSELRPAAAWLRWQAPKSIKRLTGFACRRYSEYFKAMTGESIDLGVPERLPAASKPAPRPVSDSELKALLIAAKRILPRSTSFSFRVWLRLMEELGVRRGESDLTWGSFNFGEQTVRVNGKTGPRELPLSAKLSRCLLWLRRRNRACPWLGARGQRLSVGVLYNEFKRLAATVGAPELRPHHLRHRRLTALCKSSLGANQLLVLSFSGHAHVSSLQYYYHVTLDEKRALLEVG